MTCKEKPTQKQALRSEIRKRLKALSPEEGLAEEEHTWKALFRLNEWKESRHLLVFISMPGEFDTSGIILQAYMKGKTIWAPRVERTGISFYQLSLSKAAFSSRDPKSFDPRSCNLQRNSYGIWEPSSGAEKFRPRREETALLICPGLAFDRCGNRLGRGGGYYDRWFSRMSAFIEAGTINSVGVAYSVQLVSSVPHGPHDIPIPLVIAGGTVIKTA